MPFHELTGQHVNQHDALKDSRKVIVFQLIDKCLPLIVEGTINKILQNCKIGLKESNDDRELLGDSYK